MIKPYLTNPLNEGRQPLKEDYLKILKVEYLSNHLLDRTQILNLGLGDQTMFYKSLKIRRPSTEDDLKIFKKEYLCNHLSDILKF